MVHAGFCCVTCPAHCLKQPPGAIVDRLIDAINGLSFAFCMPTMKGRRHRVRCSILGPTN